MRSHDVCIHSHMKSEKATLETLQKELEKANKKLVVEYFLISKVDKRCSVLESMYLRDEYDVYIKLQDVYFSDTERIRKLRLYIREKYGHFLRLLVIEPC